MDRLVGLPPLVGGRLAILRPHQPTDHFQVPGPAHGHDDPGAAALTLLSRMAWRDLQLSPAMR